MLVMGVLLSSPGFFGGLVVLQQKKEKKQIIRVILKTKKAKKINKKYNTHKQHIHKLLNGLYRYNAANNQRTQHLRKNCGAQTAIIH